MAGQGQFALDVLLPLDRAAGRLHRQLEHGCATPSAAGG
jgi:hypothetical protein